MMNQHWWGWLFACLLVVSLRTVLVTKRPQIEKEPPHQPYLEFTIAFEDRTDLDYSSIKKKKVNELPEVSEAPLPKELPKIEEEPASDGTRKEFLGDNLPYKRQDNNKLRLCSRQEIVDGKWYKEARKRPPYVTPTVHLRCFSKETYQTSPYHTYKWQPRAKRNKACDFAGFDKKRFCKLVENAIISIVGDSLSWEQYSSMIQLTGQHVHQNMQHQSRELNMNVVTRICNNATAVIYRRDDKIQNLTGSLMDHSPNILILNRGAHYVPDDALLPDVRSYIDTVKTWQADCKRQSKRCYFFWRTSVPGHPGCSKYTEPENDIAKLERVVNDLSLYDNHTLNYHWYDYQHQNQLVISQLQSSGIEFGILDGYHLLYRRPDEHRAHQGDCLHNCYPGKMDTYNQLLFHYLRGVATRFDQKLLPTSTIYDSVATEAAKLQRTHGKVKKRHKNIA